MTRLLDNFSILGHWSIIENLPNKDFDKICQSKFKSVTNTKTTPKNYRKHLRFCYSGEISPNMVTLVRKITNR